MWYILKSTRLACAHKYAVTVSDWFNVLSTLEDCVEMWKTFKHGALEATREWIGECPKPGGDFVSGETLASIKESHTATLLEP